MIVTLLLKEPLINSMKKDKDQFEAVQEDEGYGVLEVIKSDITGFTLEGIEQI